MQTFLLATLIAAASALQLTSPTTTDAWDLSETNTIKWTSVSTDPTSFELVLVDKSTTPETQLKIADSVSTSAGQYELTNFFVKGFQAEAETKYSIKAISTDPKNKGQLAESGTFNVTKSGAESSSSTTSAPTGTATSGGGSTSPTSGAAAVGKTFGAAGIVAIVFAMLA